MPDPRSQSSNGDSKRTLPNRKGREVIQSGGDNRRPARNNGKTTRPSRTPQPDPGEWRVNAKSAVNMTLYDMSGAPLRPDLVKELEEWVEAIAKREALVVNVTLG